MMSSYSYLSDEFWSLSEEVRKLESEIDLLKMKQEFESMKIDQDEGVRDLTNTASINQSALRR